MKVSLEQAAQLAQLYPVMEPPEGKIVQADVLSALRERLGTDGKILPLEAFIDCALYHEDCGYYRRQKERVGRSRETDFYTASSLGGLFSRLVLESARQLAGAPLQEFTFVEAGPESPQGILGHLEKHPFRETIQIRPGDACTLPPKCIVFSNELFDAQPFRRFIRRQGQWLEMGIAIGDNQLNWVESDPFSQLPELPGDMPEGYVIDWPSQAHQLMEVICGQQWEGLFITFDYGLPRSIVFSERPQGTGRTYANHQLGSDLLANPGQTDITCHVIWDELEAILKARGFQNIRMERQEAFFVHHGEHVIRDVMESGGPGFSTEKQTLMELLHPGNMGDKFQVLSGQRGDF